MKTQESNKKQQVSSTNIGKKRKEKRAAANKWNRDVNTKETLDLLPVS
tara:strand:+ start:251 stop:394 length:144 start_codon:yes stop_codon:yes gene_type:complete